MLFAGNAAIADTDHTRRCVEGERWFPDGRSIAVGGVRSFFTCDGSVGGEYSDAGEWITTSLRIDSEAYVDALLIDEYPSLNYPGKISQGMDDLGQAFSIFNEVAYSIQVEDVSYLVRVHPARLDAARDGLANGALPEGAFYHATATDVTPEHAVFCFGSPSSPVEDSIYCTLYIIYAPGENLFITQRFISVSVFADGELSLEYLPAHVRGARRAFFLMDETTHVSSEH